MPLVHECSADNCKTLTMGQFCIEHEKNKLSDHATSDALRGLAVSFNPARRASAASV